MSVLRNTILVVLAGTGCAFAQIHEPPSVHDPFPSSATVQATGDHFRNFWRKIPCAAGSLHADIVVEQVYQSHENDTGAAIQVYSDNVVKSIYLETSTDISHLSARMDEHIDDRSGRYISHPMGGSYRVGEPVSVEVAWTRKQVSFYLRGRHLWTFDVPPPTDLILMATGSPTKFDHLSVSCGLIS